MTEQSSAASWQGSAATVEAKLKARGRVMGRAAQRFVGFLLVLAGFGIWLAPGAVMAADLNLIKMVISLLCAVAGTALWQVGKAQPCAELEIDSVRQEVRLVRWTGRQRDLIELRSFEDLSRVEFDGAKVRFWQQGSALLAEVDLHDTGSLRALRAGLSRAGVDVQG